MEGEKKNKTTRSLAAACPCPSTAQSILRKICLWEDKKRIRVYVPQTWVMGSKRDEKNETTKPMNRLLDCLLPRLVPAMTPSSLCGYSSSRGKMML